ncbi:MAG: response regulator, partial [Gammaproteobacteria bacterium]|nr:response regulator [Gammaproteobacteria bacterium]
NNFVNDISAMLMPLLSKNINLKTQCADEEYFIEANEVMLSQIIMNICINAKAAMLNEQGEINIYVEKVRLHDKKCSSCFNFINGEYINLKIKDNGSGIDPQIISRIFEPFFTTKDVGKGTGMGLSMVHGIMHKHNGHIVVKSKPAEGTEFNLYFIEESNKLYDDFIEINSVENKLNINNFGNILIIDDEIAIAGFLKDFLDNYGYNVTTMSNCQQALAYYIENHNSIDLVITDYSMPEMTGIQLTQEMLKYNADMPVILCSGFSGTFTKDKIQSKNIKAYLDKPIMTSLLLQEVRKNIIQ